MKKLWIYNVIVEITRRCNLKCDHCLRGDAQNLDMSDEVMEKLLKQINQITHLFFTGGEPFLVPERLKRFLQICKEKNVKIDEISLTTNGTIWSDEILNIMKDYYTYCFKELGASYIGVSNTVYHKRLRGKVKPYYKFTDICEIIIEEQDEYNTYYMDGRAKNFDKLGYEEIKQCDEEYHIYDNEIHGGKLYVNVLGQIVSKSNLSYVSQCNNIICTVNDDIINELINSKYCSSI